MTKLTKSVFLSPRLLRTIEVFWGCDEKVRKIYHFRGVKNYFFEITVPNVCSYYIYLIIVFNNKVLGYFSKTWTSQQMHGHFKLNIIDWQRKIANHYREKEQHPDPKTMQINITGFLNGKMLGFT